MDDWPEDPIDAMAALLGVTVVVITVVVGVVVGLVRGFLHRSR